MLLFLFNSRVINVNNYIIDESVEIDIPSRIAGKWKSIGTDSLEDSTKYVVEDHLTYTIIFYKDGKGYEQCNDLAYLRCSFEWKVCGDSLFLKSIGLDPLVITNTRAVRLKTTLFEKDNIKKMKLKYTYNNGYFISYIFEKQK